MLSQYHMHVNDGCDHLAIRRKKQPYYIENLSMNKYKGARARMCVCREREKQVTFIDQTITLLNRLKEIHNKQTQTHT